MKIFLNFELSRIKKHLTLTLLISVVLVLSILFGECPLYCQEKGLVAWWTFDDGQENVTKESIGLVNDKISGNYKYVKGVSGSALKFDGFTTVVTRKGDKAPRMSGDLSVEAWLALAAYPWNWCPIVSQMQDKSRGYFFGVDARGHVGLKIFIDGNWATCTSEIKIPLKEWVHLSGTYNSKTGDFIIYVNGKEAGRHSEKGRMLFARRTDLLIGMNHEKVAPFFGRTKGNRPSWYSMDGIIDEVKIYNGTIAPKKIAQSYQSNRTSSSPEFQVRRMPSGSSNPGRFGAYYTKLKYYDEWDALWPVGPHTDIVVQFDNSPVRVVFWRGIRYSPVWVTENDIWMADQSAETGTDEAGCIEHMQDIHCRYSHVRIIENTDARVVVHWRYAPVGSRNYLWIRNEKTGWAFWVDEYYTFYPDGLGMRKMVWRRSSEGDNYPPWIQKQETIVLCHPGQTPEDVINDDFITFANFRGESFTYSWEEKLRTQRGAVPDDAYIQLVNLKSIAKPFIIFEPGSTKGYIGGNPGLYSKFSTCNHWPVAQISSDGRDALQPDRASSFLGTSTRPVIHDGPDQTFWVSWMYGMTEGSAAALAPLGKSWAQPPELKVKGQDFENRGYDFSQRAYVLKYKKSGKPSVLECDLQASKKSPVVNACLYIKDWGGNEASLKIDGKVIARGKDFRLGKVQTLDGSDLVVWIKKETTQPFKITITAEK